MDIPTVNPWTWSAASTTQKNCTVADVAYFRVETHIETLAGRVPVRLTADSRYRLTVNNEFVAAGPAKPSGGVWFVDTVDIAGQLQLGANVIGIEVLSYSADKTGNASVLRTGAPGLSVQGTLPNGIDLSDPQSWRWTPVKGRTFKQGHNTVFLGIQEDVDGGLLPRGWLSAGFDDVGWAVPQTATATGDFLDRVGRPRTLDRAIPALTLDPARFTAVSRRTDGSVNWEAFLRGMAIEVGPNRVVQVDLDAGTLITAYLDLHLVGGAGAVVELTAAECYEQPPVEIPWHRIKGDRTDSAGDLYGDPDTYRVAGVGTDQEPERFTPFWFRTFRYLRITVTTSDLPVTLSPITVTRTQYPLAITGTFASSEPSDTQLWETSVRTLLNCMHETFEDCPFYEQLQYAMDTRSQALFALHLSTDDRLVRRAIEDFAASGDPGGLTESRTPCVQTQFIPGFSLFWIFMIADHLDHIGDREFTGCYLGRIDSVLGFFDRSVSNDGFVLSPPEEEHLWNFVDWTEQWRSTRGVPHLGSRRANTISTFMYIAALRSAARIAGQCGRIGLAEEYLDRAADLTSRITASSAWDSLTGYFRDSDTGHPGSQHAQVWAVLSEAVTGQEAATLLRRAMADDSLAVCSYAMSLCLFDALRLAGLDELISWQPWHDMLAANLTTWAEDTVSNRSDCHAWGSVPLQQFPRYILGVRPSAPGFAAVTINPVPSHLEHAEGSVPTPHGPIRVRWERVDADWRRVSVRMPSTITFDPDQFARDVTQSLWGDTKELTFQQKSPSTQFSLIR